MPFNLVSSSMVSMLPCWFKINPGLCCFVMSPLLQHTNISCHQVEMKNSIGTLCFFVSDDREEIDKQDNATIITYLPSTQSLNTN